LTAREILTYAAELYDVAAKKDVSKVVTGVIAKLGLQSCADTRSARLSGGQQRRLSIAIALLKQPTILFLDEPTSGLDAAAASCIMQEITRVAREERLIILCTIHQPSTKVFNLFDLVMILSKGREAFVGNVKDAAPYFNTVGFPVPQATNPAEHYSDLVNSDFSSDEEVVHLLDSWEERRAEWNKNVSSSFCITQDHELHRTDGIPDPSRRPLARETVTMLRRHTMLILRDPVLYLGRCVIFLIANMLFAFAYWNCREYTQDQAMNKFWVSIWFIAVSSNMGVVAVYALNDEFKSILRETKNGMVSAVSYIMAKTVLVIPIMFVFAIFALGIPGYIIQDFPTSTFGTGILLWAALIYSFECIAECLAVLFDNPVIGMLHFINLWFSCFLFAGFLVPVDSLYWPLKVSRFSRFVTKRST
jgi:energy-coupling factor transporter ATP-binding protein EcfA2